ncbi:MAG: hypothetical protein SVU69_13065 [Pseudomonadota bacterium]|nr:hypothetical protein [Pseudomonadota bacterium]
MSGDLNGDDAFDNVVTISRIADQRKGDAVCRAGTYLSLVGYGLAAHQPLKPGYYTLADSLDKVEFWELRQNDQRRDELVIGQVEKSEVAIFWKHSGVKHRRLWRFVEP